MAGRQTLSWIAIVNSPCHRERRLFEGTSQQQSAQQATISQVRGAMNSRPLCIPRGFLIWIGRSRQERTVPLIHAYRRGELDGEPGSVDLAQLDV
jgi:hypothetical protein